MREGEQTGERPGDRVKERETLITLPVKFRITRGGIGSVEEPAEAAPMQ